MALIAPRRERIIAAAESLVSRGRLRAAIKEYRKVLKEAPDDTNTLNRVGDLYARLNRIPEAVDLFRQIAGHYERDGFFVKAIAIYKKVLRLDPSQRDIRGILGDLYRRQGLVIEARAQYRVLAEEQRSRRDLEGARELHRKLLEMEPKGLGNQAILVELLEHRGDLDEARDGYRFMADRMLDRGDTEAAEGIYASALDRGVANPAFVTVAVTELRRHGQTESAERLLASALEIDPEAPELNRLVGLTPQPEAESSEVAAPGAPREAPGAPREVGSSPPDHPVPPGTEPATEGRAVPPPASDGAEFELDLEQIERQIVGHLTPDAAGSSAKPADSGAGSERPESAARQAPKEGEIGTDDLLAEVAVFVKYGLESKAVERLEAILDDFPHDVAALTQLIRLHLERGSHQTVAPLATRLAALTGTEAAAEAWRELSLELESAGYELTQEAVLPPAPAAPAQAADGAVVAPRATESIEANVAWLEELAEASRKEKPAKLFDSEDEFFDLAAELEDELDTEVDLADTIDGEIAQGPTLDQIVETFRQKIGESLSETDFDTHYNLGIAYREMGLLDESITEFQLAAKDSRYLVDCCSLLGTSFLEKGFPDLAVKWYRRGLDSPITEASESLGLLYELGSLYQSIGDLSGAQESYGRITDVNPAYRDVAARLQALGPMSRG